MKIDILKSEKIRVYSCQDAKLFYKIVFGHLFLWLVVMLFITNLFKWSIHWSDDQKKLKLQNQEPDWVKKAWNYRYFHEGKSIKLLMDSVYCKSKVQEQ